MRRRDFIKSAGLAIPAVLNSSVFATDASEKRSTFGREISADVVVVGGGTGGVAAALAAARLGRRVILTEETDWIGGQLTSQAVPPDEHPWIESFGCTASYRQLRNGVRDYYRRNYPLSAAARTSSALNPGGGTVSRLCAEPRVFLAVLYEMLAPYLSSGRVLTLLNHWPFHAQTNGDRISSVSVQDLRTGEMRTLIAPFFIDATEMGDLLPLARAEYVTGAESKKETGELHAAAVANPRNHQAATWCFPMEYVDGGDFTIEKPNSYPVWRDYVPPLTPAWTGKLLAISTCDPQTLGIRKTMFDPRSNGPGWWTYRRIADPRNFAPDIRYGGVTLVNWPQNDFLVGNMFDDSEKFFKPNHFRKQERMVLDVSPTSLSLSLMYWLQTEAPHPDGKGAGWPGLRLRPDLVDTPDGLAKAPYIRESRRLRAEFTVLEQHVGLDARRLELGKGAKSSEPITAAPFADTVGVGCYRIDLHPSTGGDNYIDVSSLPFQIPLGALIPRRVENLLAGGKNLGATHITNGCYRLHPVEWNIGEAAGALAAFCVRGKRQPREVRNSPALLKEFQSLLVSAGVELHWPTVHPV